MRRFFLIALVVVVLGSAGVYRLAQYQRDPEVAYLNSHGVASWIRADKPFAVLIQPRKLHTTTFGTRIAIPREVSDAKLYLQAFRMYEVFVDGQPIDSGPEDPANWKQIHEVPLPPLAPGKHVLLVNVTNNVGPPSLFALCPQLGIRTGDGWLASMSDEDDVEPAILAATPVPPDIVNEYPTVGESFPHVAPWLVVIFVAAFLWTMWNSRPAGEDAALSPIHISPRLMRGLLLLSWVVLAANNVWQVRAGLGFDTGFHVDYVKYIVRERALPLAPDGFEMFQSPLFYMIAAPIYGTLSSFLSENSTVKLLRLLPLACGLLQIELVYRTVRAVFPTRDDLQIIGTLVGGLMPMQIYISHSISNEAFSGVLTSLAVLLCVLLLAEPARPRSMWFFVALGGAWGLTLLSKVTPILLAPLVLGAIATHTLTGRSKLWLGGVRLAAVLAVSFLICGWYYLRNWIELGAPFVAGWEPESGQVWWQEPGYRTWEQMTSFGTSLDRPVYSGCWSLLDSLHSTMWLDGFTSGLVDIAEAMPWNMSWMMVGAWLGFLPLALILGGCITMWHGSLHPARAPLIFALAAVAIFLAAVIDLYIRLPAYCNGKTFFTIGVLPCYALLAAAGAAPFVRYRYLRAVLMAGLATWGFAAYAAYFVVRY